MTVPRHSTVGPRRLLVAALLALALLAASCSSGSGSSDGTAKATSTTTGASGASKANRAYEARGSYEVGTRTLPLDDGRRVVVWYPAAESAKDQPNNNFDIASLLTPELQAQVPAELRPDYEISAHQGADPATGGPFPVVLFSHGFAGFPEQSADLVTHLASWGFVVIAPNHVERSLDGLLGTASKGVAKRDDPEVLSASLDLAIADEEAAGSPLAGLLDLDKVAVIGHSAGAYAAYQTASSEKRVKAFIAYSVGRGQPGADGKVPDNPVPKVPGMVMLGTEDGILDPAESRDVYEGMDAPKYLVEIADAGHLVFSDICLIGRDKGGLVELVHRTGLDIGEELLKLASDGCQEDALDPADAFGAIDHLSVAFLRYELGIDKEPVGLDARTAASFKTADLTLSEDAG